MDGRGGRTYFKLVSFVSLQPASFLSLSYLSLHLSILSSFFPVGLFTSCPPLPDGGFNLLPCPPSCWVRRSHGLSCRVPPPARRTNQKSWFYRVWRPGYHLLAVISSARGIRSGNPAGSQSGTEKILKTSKHLMRPDQTIVINHLSSRM